MNDRQQIIELYNHMYQAMVEKDTATLNSIHANEFVLIHMTGMRQSNHEYINAIADGTFNYYSAEHEQMDVAINGNRATLTGRSRQLQLTFQLVKRDGQWSFTSSQASTY